MSETSTRIVVLLRHLLSEPGRAHERLMGRCEAAALSWALDLRGPLGGMVTALAVGSPEREERVLAAALAQGCDRAICVSSNRAGSDLDALDYLGTATVLAGALGRIGCDLLLSGALSSDERVGAIGPAVAELCGMQHLTSVANIAAGERAGTLVVQQRGDGQVHRFLCSLPVVLCTLARNPAQDEPTIDPEETRANEPASRPAGTIERLDLGDLGVDARSLERVPAARVRPMHTSARTVMVTGADDLVTRLVEDRLLGR